MAAVNIDNNLNEGARRTKLYSGDIFVHSPCRASEELCALARDLAEEAFSPLDPEIAQHELPVEKFAEILAILKPRFIHHNRCKELIRKIVEAYGDDPEETYFDVPRLRSSTSDGYLTTGIAYAFHPHRDTWFSAPQCQVNWWLPVYPIDSTNGMSLHPEYFSKAIENTSECYNYYRWNKESRASAAKHIGVDTREQPKAIEVVKLDPDLRIVTPVGGSYQFSAAHLHTSLENLTGKTRFSIDFRTVHRADVASQTGAVNVDSKCTGTNLRDFMRCSDLSKLPEELVGPYDTEPPSEDAVLTYNPKSAG